MEIVLLALMLLIIHFLGLFTQANAQNPDNPHDQNTQYD